MDEQHKENLKRNKWIKRLAKIFVILGLGIAFHLYWPQFPFPRQRPFTKCDPNKIINLINDNFDIILPKKINSAKAAETYTSWLECNYMFILSFETDLEGWQKFHTSFPKIKESDTIYHQVDGSRQIHDVYDFMDFDPNEEDPRTEPCWGWPDWFKDKIKKGKYYCSNLLSKDKQSHLQIDTICVDLSYPDKVIIYIDGWGEYDKAMDCFKSSKRSLEKTSDLKVKFNI